MKNTIAKIMTNDKKIFFEIFSLNEKYPLIGKLGVIITRLSYHIFFAIYIIGIAAVFLLRKESLIAFTAVPLFALVLNTCLRKMIGRKRPPVNSRIGEKKTNSCPSNHSASAMVITIAFIEVFPNFGILLLPLAFLTGFSRILTGVHFPFDVLFGFFIGSLIGVAGFTILLP